MPPLPLQPSLLAVRNAVGNAVRDAIVRDAINNAIDDAVGNAIDVLAHVIIVDQYDLDLANVRIDNNVACAQDLSDDGTTDGGRDNDNVRGTDTIGRRDRGADGGGGSDLLPGRRERC